MHRIYCIKIAIAARRNLAIFIITLITEYQVLGYTVISVIFIMTLKSECPKTVINDILFEIDYYGTLYIGSVHCKLSPGLF